MNDMIIETNDAQNVTSLNKAAGVTFPALTNRTDFDAVAEPIYMANAETGRAQKIDAQIGRVIRRTDTAEAGRRTTCEACGLCKGSSIKAKNIAAVVHGSQKKNAAEAITRGASV